MLLTMALTRPDLRSMSAVPLYEQIARHIAAAVAKGDLAPGDRIPAGRDLAEDWQVGYSTLMHAMAVLQERGILVATAGKGTFVAEEQPADPR
jgi:DNA-binding GntR family transcriptional regulator